MFPFIYDGKESGTRVIWITHTLHQCLWIHVSKLQQHMLLLKTPFMSKYKIIFKFSLNVTQLALLFIASCYIVVDCCCCLLLLFMLLTSVVCYYCLLLLLVFVTCCCFYCSYHFIMVLHI